MPEVISNGEVPDLLLGKPWLRFVEAIHDAPVGEWVREEANTEGAARQAATRLRGGTRSPLAERGEFEVRRSGRYVYARLYPHPRSSSSSTQGEQTHA